MKQALKIKKFAVTQDDLFHLKNLMEQKKKIDTWVKDRIKEIEEQYFGESYKSLEKEIAESKIVIMRAVKENGRIEIGVLRAYIEVAKRKGRQWKAAAIRLFMDTFKTTSEDEAESMVREKYIPDEVEEVLKIEQS